MAIPTWMYVCVDVVVYHTPSDRILLIRRKNDPFRGKFALPGGYVDPDETAEEAALRELFEETNIRVFRKDLQFFNQYSQPDRDPRGRTLSLAFYAFITSTENAMPKDDAATISWHPTKEVLHVESELAFDHKKIVEDFAYRLMVR